MKTHKIKLRKEFCDDVLNGIKRFEVRYNDRGYCPRCGRKVK